MGMPEFLSDDLSQSRILPFGFSYGAEIDFSKDNKPLQGQLWRDSNNVVVWDIQASKELG